MEATAAAVGSEDQAKYSCSQCRKEYRRPEHLKRHQASHLSARPHRCALCQASFRRSDLLRRHERTCTGSMLKGSSSSRSACDQCVRSKKACNSLQPCLNCQRRQKNCSYGSGEQLENPKPMDHLPVDANHLNTPTQDLTTLGYMDLLSEDFQQDLADSWSDFDYAIPPGSWNGPDWPIEPMSYGQRRVALQFLERFTRNEGLVASFDCCTETERIAVRDLAAAKHLGCRFDAESPVAAQCSEIVSLIQEVITVKPRNSVVTQSWSAAVQEECAAFFSPTKLSLFVELYWTIWSPNIPFLHRPTFNIGSARPVLLAAMAVIGASVSSEEHDRSSAEAWFCCVEEAVFRDDEFYYDGSRESAFPPKSRIQALQASYIVCLFQNWQGTDSSKRRIRSFRYSTVIAVARDIGIAHARHPIYSPKTFPSFDWHEYVVREELIRTLLWIFLLDTAFVIFNNHPPRMAIKEMRTHLALNEGAFQALTREACFQLLLSSTTNTQIVLTSYCEMMCRQRLSEESSKSLADVGSLNLFVLTSALHSMIFQSQQVFGYDDQMTPIRTGLENWVTTWQKYVQIYAVLQRHQPRSTDDQAFGSLWQRIGFYRSADEYWMLAKLMVDRVAISSQIEANRTIGDEPATDDAQVKDDILGKYDETSMRQVNELITDFQRILT
ncbi:related to C2H2 transcription factor [Ramularia collo-cygni]|uniref:Related to C2H2 transcription factor n=1 Tax=Ramularia collo-cygni TaxID=112498 RepID=A0A2D3VJZ1_9PEZI|nr:related to C2H2 transcription factor [Ramularia collo-cygni]CZT23659.1 related to C2H2 transcription factor [Ramularia collo-cygni]